MLHEETSHSLAHKLFTADEVRMHEQNAAKAHGVEMFTLMQRAGQSAYRYCEQLFRAHQNYLVLVGSGNNAGDGYVLALAAHNSGKNVQVNAPNPHKKLKGDALRAQQAWIAAGGHVQAFEKAHITNADIIVDALLGSGINGHVSDEYALIINVVNSSQIPVVSLDVPSGLDANVGVAQGICIQANATVTFVGIKQGLVTGAGRQACGQLFFDDLGIASSFNHLATSHASLLFLEKCKGLAPRKVNSHKGDYGRLLCIGSNAGMSGAIRMAGEAALRTGAGLVKVFTHKASVAQVCIGRPELMVSSQGLIDALQWANCIVIGPGLGQNEWGRQTYNEVMTYCQQNPTPIVMDADALNLAASSGNYVHLQHCVITPHSGEAARLLGVSAKEVEADRFDAARQCAKRYNATCILKGPGSIVDNQHHAWICSHGNPGMATGGMGDTLAGVLGALISQGMSQGLDVQAASLYAVSIHAKAGDIVAKEYGQRGMLASDLFAALRLLINEE